MTTQSVRLGIGLMILSTFVLATQDGISRYLAEAYNVITVITIRYWFFAVFVVGVSTMRKGGVRRVARTHHPVLQVFRGLLLIAEICIGVLAFTLLGLIETHAIFACYPLLVVALSGPMLGESVGWRRWLAVGIGFLGVLIILRPGLQVFSPAALLALASALMFAIYSLVTRYVSRRDSAETSFFYTGVAGALGISLLAPFAWNPMQGWVDWGWMLMLGCTGAIGHFLLIKALEVTEANTLQPFAYFHLVFATIYGLVLFGEVLETPTLIGTVVIVAAGIYTILRTGRKPTLGERRGTV